MRNLLTAYRRVLRDPHLRRFLAGEFISGIGDWLYLVAILVMLYERTRDPILLGIVAAARVLPYVILSVPAGIVADRFDRRAILIVSDLARGALMLVLAALVAVDGDISLIVAVAIASTCFASFFAPALGAYLPSLVKSESDLGPANAAYATLSEITYIVGPALAGIVIALFDPALAFLLNALSFAVAAAVLWTLPSSRPASGDDREASREADQGGGSGTPSERRPSWRSVARPLAGLSLVDAASSFVFGGLGVLTVILAYEQLGSGEAEAGALNAAMGIGGLVASLVTGVLVLRRRLGPPLALGGAVLAIGIVVLGAGGSLQLAVLAIAAASGGALLIEVICTTLLQRIAPDEIRGRAFGVIQTVDVIAYAGGSLAIPVLVAWVGLNPLLIACAVAVVAATLASLVLLGEWASEAPSVDPVRARLAGAPPLAGLSPARLERAEREAILVPMQPGEVIIRQGDEADRFYVIVEGTVDVTQASGDDGTTRHLRTMGEGEAFGEIGLLTGVPRTATVTAKSEGRLLALDKADFLELVADAGAGTFPLADPYLGRAPASG